MKPFHRKIKFVTNGYTLWSVGRKKNGKKDLLSLISMIEDNARARDVNSAGNLAITKLLQLIHLELVEINGNLKELKKK